MKRTRPKRPMSPEDYDTFARLVAALDGNRCYACCRRPDERWRCLQRSGGRLDCHHILSQQLLKREIREPHRLWAALRDPRNGILLGRWHHDQLEHRMLRLSVDELPPRARRFAEDHDLSWALDRYYGREDLAA